MAKAVTSFSRSALGGALGIAFAILLLFLISSPAINPGPSVQPKPATVTPTAGNNENTVPSLASRNATVAFVATSSSSQNLAASPSSNSSPQAIYSSVSLEFSGILLALALVVGGGFALVISRRIYADSKDKTASRN